MMAVIESVDMSSEMFDFGRDIHHVTVSLCEQV
jgi:hypothetical protein